MAEKESIVIDDCAVAVAKMLGCYESFLKNKSVFSSTATLMTLQALLSTAEDMHGRPDTIMGSSDFIKTLTRICSKNEQQ
jgi:hypothetical protein